MPDSPDVVTAKVALRTSLLAQRASRAPEVRTAAARAVAGHLRSRLSGAGVVAGYVPTEEEPGQGRLLDALGPHVLLPVVPPSGRVLGWARWDCAPEHPGRNGTCAPAPGRDGSCSLAPGRFGLLEPTGPRLPPEALAGAAVVAVPALAVGADGTRLGRGGGFYDRALAFADPGAVLVGVLFDEELLPEVPAEPHDVRLHAVVTPSGGWQHLATGVGGDP